MHVLCSPLSALHVSVTDADVSLTDADASLTGADLSLMGAMASFTRTLWGADFATGCFYNTTCLKHGPWKVCSEITK
jgi:hypothetical protein